MIKNKNGLLDGLLAACGEEKTLLEIVLGMNPLHAENFIKLAEASELRRALAPEIRSLINIALNAAVTDHRERPLRAHMREALRRGATKEQICEVLELTSGLGIHGFIPGVQALLQVMGGLESFKKTLTAQQIAAAERAKEKFIAERGVFNDVWEANCFVSPALVEAYADYSSVPWKSTSLEPKTKELIYIAINLSPSHLELNGAAFHISLALEKFGASVDELIEVFELISLVGFQSQLLALPILKEELSRL